MPVTHGPAPSESCCGAGQKRWSAGNAKRGIKRAADRAKRERDEKKHAELTQQVELSQADKAAKKAAKEAEEAKKRKTRDARKAEKKARRVLIIPLELEARCHSLRNG